MEEPPHAQGGAASPASACEEDLEAMAAAATLTDRPSLATRLAPPTGRGGRGGGEPNGVPGVAALEAAGASGALTLEQLRVICARLAHLKALRCGEAGFGGSGPLRPCDADFLRLIAGPPANNASCAAAPRSLLDSLAEMIVALTGPSGRRPPDSAAAARALSAEGLNLLLQSLTSIAQICKRAMATLTGPDKLQGISGTEATVVALRPVRAACASVEGPLLRLLECSMRELERAPPTAGDCDAPARAALPAHALALLRHGCCECALFTFDFAPTTLAGRGDGDHYIVKRLAAFRPAAVALATRFACFGGTGKAAISRATRLAAVASATVASRPQADLEARGLLPAQRRAWAEAGPRPLWALASGLRILMVNAVLSVTGEAPGPEVRRLWTELVMPLFADALAAFRGARFGRAGQMPPPILAQAPQAQRGSSTRSRSSGSPSAPVRHGSAAVSEEIARLLRGAAAAVEGSEPAAGVPVGPADSRPLLADCLASALIGWRALVPIFGAGGGPAAGRPEIPEALVDLLLWLRRGADACCPLPSWVRSIGLMM